MDTEMLSVQFDRAGKTVTIYVAGEIDLSSAAGLTETVMNHLSPDVERVWLDVTAVTFCGSVGIAALLAIHRHVDGLGGKLTLYRPPPSMLRLLELCNADRSLYIWRGKDRERVAAR